MQVFRTKLPFISSAAASVIAVILSGGKKNELALHLVLPRAGNQACVETPAPLSEATVRPNHAATLSWMR